MLFCKLPCHLAHYQIVERFFLQILLQIGKMAGNQQFVPSNCILLLLVHHKQLASALPWDHVIVTADAIQSFYVSEQPNSVFPGCPWMFFIFHTKAGDGSATTTMGASISHGCNNIFPGQSPANAFRPPPKVLLKHISNTSFCASVLRIVPMNCTIFSFFAHSDISLSEAKGHANEHRLRQPDFLRVLRVHVLVTSGAGYEFEALFLFGL